MFAKDTHDNSESRVRVPRLEEPLCVDGPVRLAVRPEGAKTAAAQAGTTLLLMVLPAPNWRRAACNFVRIPVDTLLEILVGFHIGLMTTPRNGEFRERVTSSKRPP